MRKSIAGRRRRARRISGLNSVDTAGVPPGNRGPAGTVPGRRELPASSHEAIELPAQARAVLHEARRFETQFAGATTVWHEWGTGQQIVLLHGGSGSWTHWLRNVIPLSRAGFSVLVPDIPGFGESDIAGVNGGDANGVVAPLSAGLTELLRSEGCAIVGFSFGAMVAAMMARERPELATHLVLVAPPALGLRGHSMPLQSWRKAKDPLAQMQVHRENLALQMLHRAESVDEVAVTIHAINLRQDRMRRRRLHLTDHVLQILPTLKCQIDVIFGEEDALYRFQLSRLKPLLVSAPALRELLIVPGAGHWIQYEEPGTFNYTLERLLAN